MVKTKLSTHSKSKINSIPTTQKTELLESLQNDFQEIADDMTEHYSNTTKKYLECLFPGLLEENRSYIHDRFQGKKIFYRFSKDKYCSQYSRVARPLPCDPFEGEMYDFFNLKEIYTDHTFESYFVSDIDEKFRIYPVSKNDTVILCLVPCRIIE